jgi:hypothetical protein
MNKLLKNADEDRGYFISKVSELERCMDMYLANFFVPDDDYFAEQVIEVLIDRINFEGKRTALRVVFDKQTVTDNITKGKSVPKSITKKLLEEIRKLSLVRNYFAHYKTTIADEIYDPEDNTDYSNKVIILVQLRDNTTHISYTNEEFYNEIGKIERCIVEFGKLIE